MKYGIVKELQAQLMERLNSLLKYEEYIKEVADVLGYDILYQMHDEINKPSDKCNKGNNYDE